MFQLARGRCLTLSPKERDYQLCNPGCTTNTPLLNDECQLIGLTDLVNPCDARVINARLQEFVASEACTRFTATGVNLSL